MVSASINDREEKIMEEARHGPEDAIEIQHVSAGVDSNLDSSPRPPRGRAVFYGENNPTLTAAFRGEGNVAAEATNSSPQTMTSDSPAATSPTHEVELSPPRPATTVNEGMVSVEAPPLLEPTVEYYEAKQKYIAALERAHGASASKVQVKGGEELAYVSKWPRARAPRFLNGIAFRGLDYIKRRNELRMDETDGLGKECWTLTRDERSLSASIRSSTSSLSPP